MGNRDEIDDAELLDMTEQMSFDPNLFSKACRECGREFDVHSEDRLRANLCPDCRRDLELMREIDANAARQAAAQHTAFRRAVGYMQHPGVDPEEYRDWVGKNIAYFAKSLKAGVFPTGLIVEGEDGEIRMVDHKSLVKVPGDKKWQK